VLGKYGDSYLITHTRFSPSIEPFEMLPIRMQTQQRNLKRADTYVIILDIQVILVYLTSSLTLKQRVLDNDLEMKRNN